jgi:hypothetical protein
MTILDRQQLTELIEAADVFVRVSSQLRLLKAGRPLRDAAAVQATIRVLDEAIEGGQFMSTGAVGGMQSTLRPLTWVADVRLGVSPKKPKPDQLKDYDELVEYLSETRAVLAGILSTGAISDVSRADAVINFFQQVGDQLGIRADQSIRQSVPEMVGV